MTTAAPFAELNLPLGTWDVREPCSAYWIHRAEADAWAQDNIRGVYSTFRVEFHLLDCPCAVVYQYALDDAGHAITDPDSGDAVASAPFVQVLDELPPRRLLERSES